MAEFDSKKSNVQKLAETLKRCGIASSVTDAHRIAGDITTTEKKVQNFFDQKKKEIHQDMMQRVHPNRPELHTTQEKQIQSLRQSAIAQNNINNQSSQRPVSSDYKNDAVKEMIERAKNPRPLQVQVEFETPKTAPIIVKNQPIPQTSVDVKPEIIEKKTESPVLSLEEVIKNKPETQNVQQKPQTQVLVQEAYIPPNEILEHGKSLNELYEYHSQGKDDYINKFINNEKEEIIIDEKEETAEIKTSVHVSDVKVEINETPKYSQTHDSDSKINDAPKKEEHKIETNTEIKEAQVTSTQAPQAPKPQAPTVDIHNFFNFAKKGKV